MELNTNVPTIRFNGFDDQWSLVKLGKISSTFTDGDWIESKDQSSEGIRLVQTGNIGVNKFINKENTTKWISFETFNKLKCKEIFEGDILISRLPEPAGRSTILPRLKTKAITSVDCTIVRLKDEYTNTFINQFLSTNNYFKRVNNLLAGGTRQRISRSNLYHIDFFICSKIEQTQIGNFFKTLDSQINSQEQKHQKLINLKRAMLEKMFPKEGADLPEIRFKGFTEKWEEKKLGDVVEYKNGKAHENCIDLNGKYIVVNSKFVSTDGRVKKFSNLQLSPLFQNSLAFVLSDVPNGRAIARTYLVKVDNMYTLNQRIAGLTPKNNNYSYFLHILINRNNYFLRFDDGVKQTNLKRSDVENFITYYPCYDEQIKIGEYFEKLDNLIQKSQKQISKYKNIKQALLQKMFV